MEHVYPPGPAAVPPNLTAATSAYKRHAWLAMLGLATFIALYFALSAFFAWTAWRLLSGMFGPGGDPELLGIVAGLGSAFLAVFMLKALFFIQHRYAIEDIEITRAEQPRLFEFIDRLADEARAPRAHRVYLSPRVNAAVFYDLSLLNLIIPSKKNLEIGLGLVNVVSLGEFKAVLAHEFGHFAQRSMAVGRWVYIARQIAGHVVARRDALDKFLQQLSRLDLRIAWIGWVLSIIVWSIRSLMDALFQVVLLAERALSRQMEFQADLVAVSLTGSDALIHALHKLSAADDAWDKTLDFANAECGNKRGITDLFAVQSRIVERMREILNQPTYGIVPPVPESARAAHRVFKTELAQPPRMWATHPPSADREQNAKQRYVAATVDARSAWELFRDPQLLKEKMSAHVFRKATVEPTPMADTLSQLDKRYGRAFLNRAYRGAYLNRSPVRHAETTAALYGPPIATADLPRTLTALYPESLADDIEQHKDKQAEKAALEALRDQVAQAPGGVIRHQGRELRRSELPRVISELERDITVTRARIEAHDQQCRTAHLYAARRLGKGWPEYLQGLAALLHYADHSDANLRDAQGYVGNIYAIVTADGRVSAEELTRLIAGCQQLFSALQAIYQQSAQVGLDRTMARRLEVENWPAMLESFELPPPNRDNIGKWLEVIDGWIDAARHALLRLREAALEQLLLAESQASKFVREETAAADAAPASTVPAEYRTLLPGTERPRQKKLDWWDRFQTADGMVPAIARAAVAIGIVGSVVALGAHVGSATLTIYNGLSRPVTVEAGGERVEAAMNSPVTIDVPQSGPLHVRALIDGQEIEVFDAPLDGANAKYVYNVAHSALLYEWTAVYTTRGRGPEEASAETPLGAPRWTTTRDDYVLETPPETMQLKQGSDGYRRVLSPATGVAPWRQAKIVTNEIERAALIANHARWDAMNSPNTVDWLHLAANTPGFDDILARRLASEGTNVALLRIEQDRSEGDAHAKVCARQKAEAARDADNADLQYLSIRCGEVSAAQDAEFVAGHEKWPDNPWLAMAAGAVYLQQSDYALAKPLFEKVRREIPSLNEMSALTLARLRRLEHGMGANIADLVQSSDLLQYYASIEAGTDVGNTGLAAYSAIARGDLAAAIARAKTMGEEGHQVIRLAAASNGATPGMMKDALALPLTDDTDFNSAIAMYAVAAKAHADTAPIVAYLTKAAGTRVQPVLQFLDRVRSGEDPVKARALLDHLSAEVIFPTVYAAVIILDDKAPKAWRDEAISLFVGERGYIDTAKVARAAPPSRRDTTPAETNPRAARILGAPAS